MRCDAQGHIVTNFHVIRGASNIKVALIDSSVFPARVRRAPRPRRPQERSAAARGAVRVGRRSVGSDVPQAQGWHATRGEPGTARRAGVRQKDRLARPPRLAALAPGGARARARRSARAPQRLTISPYLYNNLSPGRQVIGGDPDKDVAVLELQAPPEKLAELKPVAVGSSANLMVGQRVYAIGNPFGLDHTLTQARAAARPCEYWGDFARQAGQPGAGSLAMPWSTHRHGSSKQTRVQRSQ
jgi:hypothetical protein